LRLPNVAQACYRCLAARHWRFFAHSW